MVQTLTLHEEKNLARGVPHPLVSTAVIVRSSGTAPLQETTTLRTSR
jgi:hypothetical protein